MITQRIDSKIEYRGYCETCRAEFMTEDPAKACPVCKNKEQVQEKETKKQNRKGGNKND